MAQTLLTFQKSDFDNLCALRTSHTSRGCGSAVGLWRSRLVDDPFAVLCEVSRQEDLCSSIISSYADEETQLLNEQDSETHEKDSRMKFP